MSKYSGQWEEAEIALRDVLDAEDALEVLQILQRQGFKSPAAQALSGSVQAASTVDPDEEASGERLSSPTALSDAALDAIEKYAATNTDAAPVDYTARLVAEVRTLNTQHDETLSRFRAAVALVYPDDMTPNGKRVFDSIIEEQGTDLAEVGLTPSGDT